MKVPYTNFKIRSGDDEVIGGCGFIGGEWKEQDTTEIFDNKKVVVFALPGAFNAWFKNQDIKKVKPIGDGEGVFTQGMDMLVNKPKQGFGMRSWRYSMLVNNGEVVKVFEEPGKNSASDDDDPFTVSDVDTMINYLKESNG